MELKDKHILLFAPPFFNYDIEIKNKLLSFGAKVDLYDDRPSSNVFIKAIIRIYRRSLSFYSARYYTRIISRNKNKNYDIVFFIKGEALTQQVLSKFRSAFPNAKFILYLWDSILNYKELQSNLPLFDRTLTFDINDSQNIESLIFRPLFYLDDYKSCAEYNAKKEIDLLFIGTVHSDRWVFLKAIKNQAEKHGLNVYYYLYIQSPLVFIARKLFDRRLRTIPIKEIKLKSISKDSVIDLMKRTKVVIDIQHPKQTGLTMRTIEMIGAKKKLLTTNTSVRNYDFFSASNIAIIDRKAPEFNLEYWKNSYEELPKDIYEKYSIDGWFQDIFHNL